MKRLKQLFWISEDNGRHTPLSSKRKISRFAALLNLLLVTALWVALFWFSLRAIHVQLDFAFLGQFRIRIWDGFLVTLGLSVFSLLLSLIIGILSAAGQSSPLLFIRFFCSVYVKFIRGTPLIMQIYLFFYIVGTAWGVNNRFVAGVLILSIFEGAYIAEIIRGSGTVGRVHPPADLAFCYPSSDDSTHPAGAYRTICIHHQRLFPAFHNCCYRINTGHARDQRRKLPAVRMLPVPRYPIFMSDAAHFADQRTLRKKVPV